MVFGGSFIGSDGFILIVFPILKANGKQWFLEQKTLKYALKISQNFWEKNTIKACHQKVLTNHWRFGDYSICNSNDCFGLKVSGRKIYTIA